MVLVQKGEIIKHSASKLLLRLGLIFNVHQYETVLVLKLALGKEIYFTPNSIPT